MTKGESTTNIHESLTLEQFLMQAKFLKNLIIDGFTEYPLSLQKQSIQEMGTLHA